MTAYYLGVVPLPFGLAAGGQGVPDGVVPVPGCELPAVPLVLFPEVEGDEFEAPEFEDSEFGDPAAVPGAGVDPFGVPAVPGKGPQGEPPGVVPGVVCVLGFTVEGCVLLPGVGVFGEFDPGMLPGCCVCGVAVPAGGVAVLAGGVAVWAGGVAVWAGGVAVWAGGVAVPGGGVAECGADPAAGALCATAQAAHKRITDSSVVFCIDISGPPDLNTLEHGFKLPKFARIHFSLRVRQGRSYPADAVGYGENCVEI